MQTKKRLYFNLRDGNGSGHLTSVERPSLSVTYEEAFSRRGESPSIIDEISALTAPVNASELNPIGASYGWSWKR